MIGLLGDSGLTMDDQGYLTLATDVPIDQFRFVEGGRALSTRGLRP